MWRRSTLLMAVCVGCGSASGPTDAWTEALPSRQTLAVTAPSAHAGAAASGAALDVVGQTAGLALLTWQTTAQMNGLVGGVLDTLSSVTRNRPAAVGPNSAVWGPIPDGVAPLVWRLVVNQVGPGEHTFELQVRANAGDMDFVPFLQGASGGASPNGPSEGTFAVDLATAHQLDPVGHPDDGQVAASWYAAEQQRQVHVQLAGVHDASQPPASGAFDALVFADGSGVLNFEANTDLVGSAQTLEVGRVASQWNDVGAGRADAEVHGGAAGGGGVLSECWIAGGTLVYQSALGADGGSATAGDVSACVFAAPVG